MIEYHISGEIKCLPVIAESQRTIKWQAKNEHKKHKIVRNNKSEQTIKALHKR